jgi:hypothetical protein
MKLVLTQVLLPQGNTDNLTGGDARLTMIRISIFNRGWLNSYCRPMRQWKGAGEIVRKALTLKDLNGDQFQVSRFS